MARSHWFPHMFRTMSETRTVIRLFLMEDEISPYICWVWRRFNSYWYNHSNTKLPIGPTALYHWPDEDPFSLMSYRQNNKPLWPSFKRMRNGCCNNKTLLAPLSTFLTRETIVVANYTLMRMKYVCKIRYMVPILPPPPCKPYPDISYKIFSRSVPYLAQAVQVCSPSPCMFWNTPPCSITLAVGNLIA